MREEKVAFYSDGLKLDASIYRSDSPEEALPAVITCSGFQGFNATHPARFARAFTQRGYTCFGFDYRAKYLAKATQEICPGRFEPEVALQIMGQALRAHRALSCRGYSRSDFIVSDRRPVFLETNTLPGLTKASLYPKALKAQGIDFADFLHQPIALAERRIHG